MFVFNTGVCACVCVCVFVFFVADERGSDQWKKKCWDVAVGNYNSTAPISVQIFHSSLFKPSSKVRCEKWPLGKWPQSLSSHLILFENTLVCRLKRHLPSAALYDCFSWLELRPLLWTEGVEVIAVCITAPLLLIEQQPHGGVYRTLSHISYSMGCK